MAYKPSVPIGWRAPPPNLPNGNHFIRFIHSVLIQSIVVGGDGDADVRSDAIRSYTHLLFENKKQKKNNGTSEQWQETIEFFLLVFRIIKTQRKYALCDTIVN